MIDAAKSAICPMISGSVPYLEDRLTTYENHREIDVAIYYSNAHVSSNLSFRGIEQESQGSG